LQSLEVRRVVSEQELRDVYTLRYQVYCRERGYERPEDHPGFVEVDEYDPYSLHFIAYLNDVPAGTSRLILPNPIGFPVERYCKVKTAEFYGDGQLAAEISRLAVSTAVTREQSIRKTVLTLSLIREMFRAGNVHNIDCVFCAMSMGLERLLKRCGIWFLQAGEPVEYHGLRTPYFASLDSLRQKLSMNRKDIYDVLFPAYEADAPMSEAGHHLLVGHA
jgi:N-acyl-L-homoserine lactone synthetase